MRSLIRAHALAVVLTCACSAAQNTSNPIQQERDLRAAVADARNVGLCASGLLFGLAMFFIRRGRTDDAMATAAEMESECEPSTAIEEARELTQAGAICLTVGLLSAAEQSFRDSLEIYERETGPTSPDTARALNNLGSALTARGENERALPILKRALHLLELDLPGDEVVRGIAAANLSHVFSRLGMYEEAEPLVWRAIQAAKESGIRASQVYAIASMAEVMLGRREFEKAESFIAEALSLAEEEFASPHAILASLTHMRAIVRGSQRRGTAAIADLKQAIHIAEQLPPGAAGVHLAGYLIDYRDALRVMGRKAEAKVVERRLRGMMKPGSME